MQERRRRGNPNLTREAARRRATLARTDLNQVVGLVMSETGVSHEEITGPIRLDHILRAKRRAMLLLAEKGWKQRQIADALACDRSSVRHGLQQAQKDAAEEQRP